MEELLALDRGSVRRVDQDGHLHIGVSNFSRATVSPYLGEDIPDWEKLGLDPRRVYHLLRPADELQRAAPSFNGKPLLLIHKPLSADAHPREITVGSVGTDVHFANPWLRGSLAVWDQEGIDGIYDGSAKHLSCGYRYVPVMKPGVFEGQRYDGVMTRLAGNHIALVEEPRVPGAVVGDAALRMEAPSMPPVATMERPRVAAHFHDGLRDGKLALDATLEEVTQFLSLLEPSGGAPGAEMPGDPAADPMAAPAADPMTTLAPPPDELVDAAPDPTAPPGAPPEAPPGADPAADPGAPPADPAAGGDDKMAQLLSILQANLPPEIMAQVRQLAAEIAGGGAPPDAGAPPGAPPEGPPDASPPDASPPPAESPSGPPSDQPPSEKKSEDEMPPGLPTAGKTAMDAASIEASVIKRMNDRDDALEAVRPLVGALPARRFAKAEEVFRFALDSIGVDTKPMHPSAFGGMVAFLAKQSRTQETAAPAVAMDAAQHDEMLKRFPHYNRLKVAS